MKSKYILDDEDFNRILEISANPKPVAQMRDGKLSWTSHQERADAFWKSIANKYRFYPGTEEQNINPEDPREFVAKSSKHTSDSYCVLCDKVTGPEHHSGCDRSDEHGCAWYSDIRPSGKRDLEQDGYTDAVKDIANYMNVTGLSVCRGVTVIDNPEYYFNELLKKNGIDKILVFSSGTYTYIE